MKMEVPCEVMSYTKNRRKAMVRVFMEEGSSRRSITRHVISHDGGKTFIGHNPDSMAISFNQDSDVRLKSACRKVEFLANATERAEALVAEEEVSEEVKASFETLKNQLHEARMAFEAAREYQKKVQEEFPLEVIFVPGRMKIRQ